MSATHISMDSETLSLSSNPLLLAIGAVPFDPHGNDTVSSLREKGIYIVINPAQQQEVYGRDVDASTALWWMKQSDAARAAIVDHQKQATYLPAALARFSQWVEDAGGTHLWTHGAAEDAVWIRNAYSATSMRFPFHYRKIRDTRTLFDLAKTEDVDMPGLIEHYALDDAIYQALRVQEAYRKLNIQEKA